MKFVTISDLYYHYTEVLSELWRIHIIIPQLQKIGQDLMKGRWNVAGPQNRIGYISYIGGVPSDRLGSINVNPPTLFGNYGTSQVHKSK